MTVSSRNPECLNTIMDVIKRWLDRTRATVALGFLLLPAIVEAQIEKRVVFTTRKPVAIFKGRLPLDPAYDSYFFRAHKGQTLTIKLTSNDPDAYVAIYETKDLGPVEDTIVANDIRSREWAGRLPITSEYSVQVYDAGENGLTRFPYTLVITLR
jgi:hypothetical protein